MCSIHISSSCPVCWRDNTFLPVSGRILTAGTFPRNQEPFEELGAFWSQEQGSKFSPGETDLHHKMSPLGESCFPKVQELHADRFWPFDRFWEVEQFISAAISKDTSLLFVFFFFVILRFEMESQKKRTTDGLMKRCKQSWAFTQRRSSQNWKQRGTGVSVYPAVNLKEWSSVYCTLMPFWWRLTGK